MPLHTGLHQRYGLGLSSKAQNRWPLGVGMTCGSISMGSLWWKSVLGTWGPVSPVGRSVWTLPAIQVLYTNTDMNGAEFSIVLYSGINVRFSYTGGSYITPQYGFVSPTTGLCVITSTLPAEQVLVELEVKINCTDIIERSCMLSGCFDNWSDRLSSQYIVSVILESLFLFFIWFTNVGRREVSLLHFPRGAAALCLQSVHPDGKLSVHCGSCWGATQGLHCHGNRGPPPEWHSGWGGPGWYLLSGATLHCHHTQG